MKWFIHHGKRVARITAGVVVILVGLFLMIPGVPGPGFIVVFAGLSILAVDFVWAHRLKTKFKDGATKMVDKVRGNLRAQRLGRRLLQVVAVLFLLQVLGVLIGPPRWLQDWLSATAYLPKEQPRYIIVLGGGGIPSTSTLIRTYYAAEYGRGLTGTTFIVSLPTDSDPNTSSVGRMRDELVRRGIPASSIQMEYRGLDTHQEAAYIRKMLDASAIHEPILVISSEYHLRRAMLCFRKEGFTRVSALDASGIGAEAEMGPWSWLRYGIWNNAGNEARIIREFLALLTYKLRGWI